MTLMNLIVFILIFSTLSGLAQIPGMDQIPGMNQIPGMDQVAGIECDTIGGVTVVDNSLMDTINAFTSTCSSFSLKIQRTDIQTDTQRLQALLNRERNRDQRRFDFDGYSRLSSEELCQCLKTNPYIDLRVPDLQRDIFRMDNIRRGSSNVFKTALQELQGNITKFKNLNLDRSLHERSKSLCSVNSIINDITYTLAQRTKPTCQGGSMDVKLTQIFGNADPAYIARKINSDTLEVNENSCITRQEFMRLRSSPTSAVPGSQFYTDTGIDLKAFQPDEDIQGDTGFAELLSYDLFFNLGYRNPQFSSLMRTKTQTKISNDPEGFYQIYNDPEIQSQALATIEAQCESFKENLKEYLCSDDQQKINSKAMSVIVRDELTARETPPDLQFLVDFHTKKNSCEPEPPVTPANQRYNRFIEQELLLSKASNDSMSDHVNSEYQEFNNTFCGNKKGQVADLATIARDFVSSKGIAAALMDPAIIQEAGLIIDVTKNPMISYAPGTNDKELPSIDTMVWSSIIWPKIKDKISIQEGEQLYALFEMQTNLRARDVKSIRDRVIANNPALRDLSPRDVDSIIRGDQNAIDQIQLRFVANAEVDLTELRNIPTLYLEQVVNRAERFNMPLSPGVLAEVGNVVSSEVATTAQVESVILGPQNQTSEVASGSTELVARREVPQTRTTGALVPTSTGFTAGASTPGVSSSLPTTSSQTAKTDDASVSGQTNVTTRAENPNVKKLKDEIKQIQDEIAERQRTLDQNSRRVRSLGKTNPAASSGVGQRVSDAQTSFRENYNFPRNLPVKTENGEYYMPGAEGSELSSASNKNSSKDSGKSQGGSGGSAVAAGGGPSSGGGGSSGGGSGGGGGSAALGSGGSRSPASAEADEKLREELKLPVYEYPRFIPHSLIDMVGSIEKVVIMLGLEGKLFKTIEAIEEYDEKTGKIQIKYFQRYYDFVPGNEFKNLSVGFSDKETREKIFKENFSFARTPENLFKSKKFARATKEVLKEEVEHNYVLGIQNQILSDDEVRKTIEKTMQLLN